MKNSSIKTVVAVGIGAALFFVLGRFVAIPSGIPNTNISLQYAILGMLGGMYGPVAGTGVPCGRSSGVSCGTAEAFGRASW